MIDQLKTIRTFPLLNRFNEDAKYNQILYSASMFPYITKLSSGNLNKLVLNFSFRDIHFNKKQALPFFLALELLTKQKCIATVSSKNILVWKLRKGMLVGCKVTLRSKNLYEFFDTLSLTMPRMEKLNPIFKQLLNHKELPTLSLKFKELVFFYPLELALGINTDVKQIEMHFLFNILSLEEKIFLISSYKIPIEN